MNLLYIRMLIQLKTIAQREEGQDLVEYALVVAMIAFGAVAGMSALSGGINSAFKNISTVLGKYTA